MKCEDVKQLATQALTDLQQRCSKDTVKPSSGSSTVMGRFYHYSWNNCLLIAFQMPDASYVAGFRAGWNWVGTSARGKRASAS